MMNRDGYIQQLTERVCTVTFKKKSGEQRVMKATLLPDVIPEVKNSRDAGTNYITVYDVENEGWRTIIVNTIESFV